MAEQRGENDRKHSRVISSAKYTEGSELIDELSDRMFQEIRNIVHAYRQLGYHLTFDGQIVVSLRQEDGGPLVAKYLRTIEITVDPS